MCPAEKETLFKTMAGLKDKLNVDTLNILEIGIGGGQNFRHYPPGTKVTALDPNPENRSHVDHSKVASDVELVKFIPAFAERMPEAESESFHAVVATLTLCTVQDPKAVLKEVHRVLVPGGVFFYLEHVAGEGGTFIRKCQNIIQLIWPYIFYGCCINRETWTFLDKAGFKDVKYKRFSVNIWAMFFYRPFMYGTATK